MRSRPTSSRAIAAFFAVFLAATLSRIDTAEAQPKPAPTQPAGAPTAAGANDKANEAKAQELFKKSAEAYRRGDFKESIALLQEAYRLHPDPVLLYNLGRAYDGIGDRVAARDAYTRYVKDDPNAPDRGAIEQRIVTLQREIDEKSAAEKQQQDDQARREKEEADRKKREEDQKAEEQRRAADQGGKRSIFPYVVMGVGAAGLVNGAVFGVLSGSAHDDAKKEPVQTKAIDDQNNAKTFATVANVSFIAGGALVVGGAVWWYLDSPKKTQPQTGQAHETPRVVPAVGLGTVGVVGTF
jgi:tetratricopeptide (TPR) repeat protein